MKPWIAPMAVLPLLWTAALPPAPGAAQALEPYSVCQPEDVARRSSHTLLGVALQDTVPVDFGTAFQVWSGDSDTALYAQAFALEAAAPEVQADTVLLVRWQGSPDGPPYWSPDPSSRATEPGERRVVFAHLREEAHWSVHPTFDVRWAGDMYPADGHREAAGDLELMTPEEYFDFCAVEVDPDLVRRGDWSERIEPMDWARASDGEWSKYPAQQKLSSLAFDIERYRVLGLEVDLGGTWAVSVTLPSGRVLDFALRTSDQVAEPWWRSIPGREPLVDPPWEFRVDGYTVRTWLAETVADLPEAQGDSASLPCRGPFPPPVVDQSCSAGGAWAIGFRDLTSGSRLGAGDFLALVNSFYDQDVEIWEETMILIYERQDERRASRRERRVLDEFLQPGEFNVSGSSLEYAQTIPLSGNRSIRITAVQVSSDVVREVRD